jgi:hypothetical protein
MVRRPVAGMISLWGVIDLGNVLWLGTKDAGETLRNSGAQAELAQLGLRLTKPGPANAYADNPFGTPVSFKATGRSLSKEWTEMARERARSRQIRFEALRLDPDAVAAAIEQVRMKKVRIDVYALGLAIISAKLVNTPDDLDMQAWIFESFEYSFYVQPGSVSGNPVNATIHRFAALVRRHLTLHAFGDLLARPSAEGMPAESIYCACFSAVGEIRDLALAEHFKAPGRGLMRFDLRHSTLYAGWWISFLHRSDPDVIDTGAIDTLMYVDLSWVALKAFERFFLEAFNAQAAVSLLAKVGEPEPLSFEELRALRMVCESVAICGDIESRANSFLVIKLLRHLAEIANLTHLQANVRYYSVVFADHMRNITKDAEDRHAKRLQAIAIWLTVASAVAACIAVFQLLSETKLVHVQERWSSDVPNSLILLLVALIAVALSAVVTWFYRIRR